MRPTRLLVSAGVVVLACSVAAPAPAGAGTAPPTAAGTAPSRIEVSAPRLDATVSWAAPVALGLEAYRVEVTDGRGELVESVVVPADQTSTTIGDVPVWDEQYARVFAVYDDGRQVGSDFSDVFRVLPTLELDDAAPLVQTGDGACCETYTRSRGFHLDAPMPVDVWLQPVVVEFEGSGAVDGLEETDPRWPSAIDDHVIRIPAGTTRGHYDISWWGDEWKRFAFARSVFGFEPSYVPNAGEVHLDRARQSFTLVEDDAHLWPEVSIAPRARAAAGAVARVRVRLDTAARRATSVRYRLVGGSARVGQDFRRTAGTTTIARGQRTALIRVPTLERNHAQRSRSFTVQVTGVRDDLGRLGPLTRSVVTLVDRQRSRTPVIGRRAPG